MSSPYRIALVLQRAALVALAAAGVHQLRYITAYGGVAGEALADNGHRYLAYALPAVAGLALAAVALTIANGVLTSRARHVPRTPPRRRLTRSCWYAAALVSVFVAQELIEGALVAGHPDGLEAVLSRGGWTALPLAATVGALLLHVVRGLRAIETGIAAQLSSPHGRAPSAAGAPYHVHMQPSASRTLAFGLARRPPPDLALDC